jgi:hypothetical protein
MQDGLRLPLQIGTSSLLSFARAGSAMVPGLLLVASIAFPLILAPWDEAVVTYRDLWWAILLAVAVGQALAYHGIKHLGLAIRERASDIVLSDSGLRVESGRASGFNAAWEAIAGCTVKATHEKSIEVIDTDEKAANFWQLVLELDDASEVVLASAENQRERSSLEDIRESIGASLKERAGERPPRAKKTKGAANDARPARPTKPVASVLRCGTCGAPAGLVDAPTLACGFCAAVVHVPDDLRARCRAALQRNASQARRNQLLGKLLRQPGALRTNIALGLAATPMLLAFPVVSIVAGVLYALCYLRAFDVVLLCSSGLAIVWAFFFLVRGRLTDRRAVRLVTLQFAAAAPEKAGAPHRCRDCNAPLIETRGQLLAHCAYCDAENVLGVDARPEARSSSDQEASLEVALAARDRERTKIRGGIATAFGMLALAGVLIAITLRSPHQLVVSGDAADLTRISYDPFDEFNPKLSPDGRTVLYDLRAPENDEDEGNEALMTMDAEGGFRGTEMTHESVHAIRPVFLPDGHGFLFVSSPAGKPATLWRVDSLTPYAPKETIATTGFDMGVPDVSPDGTRVVYAGMEKKKGGWSVYTASTSAGGKSTSLTGGINPVWSPSGDQIVYSLTVGNSRQLHLRNADGTGKATQLTDTPFDHEDAVFSPDGTRLLFLVHTAPKIWDIYAMHADGTHLQRLTSGDTYVETPTWHGDYVYFSANIAGNFDVWRITLRGDLRGHGHG